MKGITDNLCFEETTILANKHEKTKGCYRWNENCKTKLGLSQPAKLSQFCTQGRQGAKMFSFNATAKSPSHWFTPEVHVQFSVGDSKSWLEFTLAVEAEQWPNLTGKNKLSPALISPHRTELSLPKYQYDYILAVKANSAMLYDQQRKTDEKLFIHSVFQDKDLKGKFNSSFSLRCFVSSLPL